MSTEILSHAEFYKSHKGYGKFDQMHRDGGAYGLSFIRVSQEAHDFTDPAVEEIVVTLSLQSDMPFRWNIGDGWSNEFRCVAGSMNVCPPGTAIQYDCGGHHDILIATCGLAELEELLGHYSMSSADVLSPLHSATIVHDGAVSGALKAMWRESERNGGASAMMIDGLWQTVVGRLLQRADIAVAPSGEQLSNHEFNLLEAYIEAHLDRALNTKDLARVLDRRIADVSQAIQQTVGQTPHQYVLSRRIARAQELLAAGTMPLVEIAYACGFASQSHMTDVFRQKLGVTPGRYRKEVQS